MGGSRKDASLVMQPDHVEPYTTDQSLKIVFILFFNDDHTYIDIVELDI
jgi:hypothetical protein